MLLLSLRPLACPHAPSTPLGLARTCHYEDGVCPPWVRGQVEGGVVNLALVHKPRALLAVVLRHLLQGVVLGTSLVGRQQEQVKSEEARGGQGRAGQGRAGQARAGQA